MAPVASEDKPVDDGTVPQGKRERIFVVGLGMVGIAFIEKMLSLDTIKRYHITTCGEEPHLAYNRVGLVSASFDVQREHPLTSCRPTISNTGASRTSTSIRRRGTPSRSPTGSSFTSASK